MAKLAGAIWLALGLVVVGARTGWYRRPLRLPDPSIYE
jgi:hypothetical protein